jgi:hypothetical protein
MDVASGKGNPINKSLMACNAILVRLDQFLQPVWSRNRNCRKDGELSILGVASPVGDG